MKSGGPKTKARAYRMTARAEKAAQTADRILDAAYRRFATMEFDEVTLGAVAEDAGVTVQTVIRRFGGKDGLFEALVQREGPRIDADRTPAGGEDASLEQALHALVGHYEKDGAAILNFLKQEARCAPLASVVAAGREAHARWVKTYCRARLAG
jgi:AcrR family transcriptional regulator